MSQRVHLHQWCHACRVTEVVGVDALREGGACGRFQGANRRIDVPFQLLAQEREGQAGEVGPATGAADEHVGRLSDLGELPQGFLADDRLVEQDVVQHAAQRVANGGILRGHLDCLGDGDTERPGAVGILGEDRPPGFRQVGRTRVHGGAPGLHHRFAVRLLIEGGGDLPDLAFETEQRTGEGEGAAPLTGAGLGGELLDALLGVVVRLGDGGVGLV